MLPVLPDVSTVMMSFGRTCVPSKTMTTSPDTGPVRVQQACEGDGESAEATKRFYEMGSDCVEAVNAIAGERVDRSAEFAAYLPIGRRRALTSKAIVAGVVCAVLFLVNLAVFGATVAEYLAGVNPTLIAARFHNSLVRLLAGACDLTCSEPWLDCDDTFANGCETDVDTTVLHCGACHEATYGH